jgi:hypothetical protein
VCKMEYVCLQSHSGLSPLSIIVPPLSNPSHCTLRFVGIASSLRSNRILLVDLEMK